MAKAPHDVRAYVLENLKFHSIVLGAADTERLFFIVRRLLQIPMSYKAAFWSEKGARDLTLAGHRRVVAALRAGNADEAATAMREHLMDVARARAAQAAGKTVRGPSPRKAGTVAPSRRRAS
jgi:DNA-binding GntR family transcriptional regulator